MSDHSQTPPPPRKERVSVERLAIAVIVYGQSVVTALLALILAFVILEFHLMPNYLYRIIAVVFLLAVAVIYVPLSIKDIYEEVERRGIK